MEIGISTTLTIVVSTISTGKKDLTYLIYQVMQYVTIQRYCLVLIVGICRVTRSTAMVLTECRYFFLFFLGGGGFVLKPPFFK